MRTRVGAHRARPGPAFVSRGSERRSACRRFTAVSPSAQANALSALACPLLHHRSGGRASLGQEAADIAAARAGPVRHRLAQCPLAQRLAARDLYPRGAGLPHHLLSAARGQAPGRRAGGPPQGSWPVCLRLSWRTHIGQDPCGYAPGTADLPMLALTADVAERHGRQLQLHPRGHSARSDDRVLELRARHQRHRAGGAGPRRAAVPRPVGPHGGRPTHARAAPAAMRSPAGRRLGERQREARRGR